MDGLFWIDPYPDEPLGPGAFSRLDDKWVVYDDLTGMTFRWRGGPTILIYDRARNFRLFESWVFSTMAPSLEDADRAIRRKIRQFMEWMNAHPKEHLGDQSAAQLLIRSLPGG